MPELYLIAHKVRDELALDVAIRCDDMGTSTDPGPWWIIPTSGHRARPFWEYKVDDLYCHPDKGSLCVRELIGTDTPPDDLPDHYRAHDEYYNKVGEIRVSRPHPTIDDL